MKKGILLSLLAVILLAVVVCAIWYINEEGKMRAGSKDSFIPYNSAVVVTVNAGAELAPEIRQAFAADLKVFRRKLLVRITDTLQQQGLVKAHPYVVAARVEGKSDVAFLYVMDNKDVISRGEVTDFLNRTFAAGGEKVRKYDRHKIYTLKQGKEIAYFAVCGVPSKRVTNTRFPSVNKTSPVPFPSQSTIFISNRSDNPSTREVSV